VFIVDGYTPHVSNERLRRKWGTLKLKASKPRGQQGRSPSQCWECIFSPRNNSLPVCQVYKWQPIYFLICKNSFHSRTVLHTRTAGELTWSTEHAPKLLAAGASYCPGRYWGAYIALSRPHNWWVGAYRSTALLQEPHPNSALQTSSLPFPRNVDFVPTPLQRRASRGFSAIADLKNSSICICVELWNSSTLVESRCRVVNYSNLLRLFDVLRRYAPRINSCQVMSCHVMAAILDLIELEIAPFDPPNPALKPNTTVMERLLPEIVIWNFQDGGRRPSWIWCNR